MNKSVIAALIFGMLFALFQTSCFFWRPRRSRCYRNRRGRLVCPRGRARGHRKVHHRRRR